MIGRRVLILVPYPDDEIVWCGAAIARARRRPRRLRALPDHGRRACRDALALAALRSRRARAAASRRSGAVAERIGLEPVDFLPWPARTLRLHLAEARAHVAALLADPALGIDTVWAPAYEGGHQDHDVTNMLASTLDGAGGPVQVLEFAEYNYRDGIVRSHEFVAPSHDDVVLVLTAEERQLKADLLGTYASERANLRHIQIGRERFRHLARYDYSRPPHPSPLFYERFHWIPFRQPRVDFTSAAQICEAMAQFRRERSA
jgi:LmbE family N-acetylglucosaminyl deacetylase